MATYCCDAANSYAICSLRRSTKPVAAIASHPNRPAAALPAGRAVTMRAMATCLVTGGAGFLGSHLCDELLRREHRVICVDNLETGSPANIHAHPRPGFPPPDPRHHRGLLGGGADRLRLPPGLAGLSHRLPAPAAA